MTIKFLDRTYDVVGRFFTALDQLAGLILRSPFYILGLGQIPSADQTISAFVGINAIKGKRWALVAEKVINFFWGEGHCRHAIITDPKD